MQANMSITIFVRFAFTYDDAYAKFPLFGFRRYRLFFHFYQICQNPDVYAYGSYATDRTTQSQTYPTSKPLSP